MDATPLYAIKNTAIGVIIIIINHDLVEIQSFLRCRASTSAMKTSKILQIIFMKKIFGLTNVQNSHKNHKKQKKMFAQT